MQTFRRILASVMLVLIVWLGNGFMFQSVTATTETLFSKADTYLREEFPDIPFGDIDTINSGLSEDKRMRGLVKFDLSWLPSGSTINSATLKLRVSGASENDPFDIEFTTYRATFDWTQSSVTWNSVSGGTWSTDNAATSPLKFLGQDTVWDVTGIITDWIEDGQPNYGFIIISSTIEAGTEDLFAGFASRESSPKPRLVLDYTAPPFLRQIVLTTYPLSVTAGSWTSQYTIQRQDQDGNPWTSGSTTVDLASTSTGLNKRFALTSGGASVTTVTIVDGSSTADFYYYDEVAGSHIISTSSTGLIGDSETLTVDVAPLDHFEFGLISSPQQAGNSFYITITAKDPYGNTVADYVGPNSLSDSTGTINPSSTDSKPFTAGSWNDEVIITKSQIDVTITTSGNSKSGTSNMFNVNPAGANKLVITNYPSSVIAGAWTSKYTVQRQDQYGNPVTSGSTTVDLASTSTGLNKRFALTSGGASVTTVTIVDGSSTADFYYYDEAVGTWTISVSTGGLIGDDKDLTVGVSSASVETSTGSGTATFELSTGCIEELIAVDETSLPSVGKPELAFPNGFFSFKIGCLSQGDTVTITITLPSNVDENTQYWKYGPTPDNPSDHWYQIPIIIINGNQIIIQITDGGLGDDDITKNTKLADQGAPGNSPIVIGGIATTVNKLSIIAPYITLVGIIIVSTAYVFKSRKG